MLHCNVVMKVTNEKKCIFSFYSHNMNKKIQLEPFPYIELNVSIKSVLKVINKNKDESVVTKLSPI